MKKKLILIALCGALALGVAGCSASEEIGDMVSDAGEAASELIDDAGDMASEAASDMTGSNIERETSDVTSSEIETSDDALSALETGNQTFRSGAVDMNVSPALRTNLAENGQNPHTIVITCSDSRVSPELIFNCGLGDLFVIRTAGNVVGDYEIGSVEYAADHLGSLQVVVMGHTECGAVSAAVEGHAEGSIEAIVEEIEPSVTTAKAQETEKDQIVSAAVDLNVENSIQKLKESEILAGLIEEGKLTIRGARYDIATGEVSFFDDAATSPAQL